tara:strand:+ start:226 stop:582 length:357 start_codon:yes stop_codon:yes gene_type:complete
METITTIQKSQISVNTTIKFQIEKSSVAKRQMDYSSTSVDSFKVNRSLMACDVRNWSDKVLERKIKDGAETYGEFMSIEMATIFCDALNNKTQQELIDLSIADDYKMTLSENMIVEHL